MSLLNRRRHRSRNSSKCLSLQVLLNNILRHRHHRQLYPGMLPYRSRRSMNLLRRLHFLES